MYLRNLNRRYFLFLTIFIFVVVFSIVFKASATPPATPYTPGETLNPTCSPIDTNCTVSVSSSGWGLTGNAGINPATNFIGTIDAQPLIFKVNNSQVGLIDNNLRNVFWGDGVGVLNSTGDSNTVVGSSSFGSNTLGQSNTALGNNVLGSNTIGQSNTSIGAYSLVDNTTGNNNTTLGFQSLTTNSTGDNNVAIGFQAGYSETTSNNLFIDNQARFTNERLKALIYGKFDASTANQFVNINGTLGIVDATDTYYTNFTGGSQVADITYTLPTTQGGASTVLTNDGSGTLSWVSGGGGGWSLTGNSGLASDGSNFIGTTDSAPLYFKQNNHVVGKLDIYNTFLGYDSGNVNVGSANAGFGFRTLYNNTSGIGNTAVGDGALIHNTTGNYNTANGQNALLTTTTSSGNVALGYKAGYYETGSDNLFIDNQDRGNEADERIKSLIYGKFDADPANQFVTINGKLNVKGGMNISSLPTSSSGLVSGDLWNNVGVVNIIP